MSESTITPLKQDNPFDDALFLKLSKEHQHVLNLFSLLSHSLSHAAVMTTMYSGLGTALPFGPSIPSESLYYKSIRALTAFDKELTQKLLGSKSIPDTVIAIAGRFSTPFIKQFPEVDSKQIVLAKQCLEILAPQTRLFQFCELSESDYTKNFESKSITFSKELYTELQQGTLSKLELIRSTTNQAKGQSMADKLKTMLGAFTPLCTVFDAALGKASKEQAYTRLTLYFPPLHTFHAENLDSPQSWYLEEGIAAFPLPRPIQISAASLFEMSYLQQASKEDEKQKIHPGIKLEIKRDFKSPHQITLIGYFGRFFQNDSEDRLGFDFSHTQDAFYLKLNVLAPLAEEDGERTQAAKKVFNQVFAGFQIEAKIHQLTLHLHHSLAADQSIGDDLLTPAFSLDDSKISFGVHRTTDSKIERLSLQAAGFQYETIGNGQWHCWRDFWTWDHFKRFFKGELSNDSSRAENLFIAGRERLLKQVIGSATKAVLDHSIESIEQAIDDEMAQILSHSFERYVLARKILSERLHQGLF